MKAVYKCRMCGKTYTVQQAGKDIAKMCMIELVAGVRGSVPGAPSIIDMHHCGGEHDGDLGLADFQGWEKEE